MKNLNYSYLVKMNKEHKKINYVNYCHVLNPGIAFVMFPSLYLKIVKELCSPFKIKFYSNFSHAGCF